MLSKRAAICSAVSARTRAAASSSASGRPSSWTQICATAAVLLVVKPNAGSSVEGACVIPYGETRSYQEIAARAGGSARSVGQANGRNPIPLIIPCHRVVAAGHIGGYSGGDGLPTKRWLLALEDPTRTLL